MKRVVMYFKGPYFYKSTFISPKLYEQFNKENAPAKRIGERLKQNGVGYLYYKEYFEGDEKPAPAKDFFDILKATGFASPETISFWHVEEVDE